MQLKVSLDICLIHSNIAELFKFSQFSKKESKNVKKTVKMYKNYFYEVYNGQAACQKTHKSR